MIILGLGSNVGDRLENLNKALELLSQSVLVITEISSIYETEALLKENAPESWNRSFLNMAISGETHLSAEDLLLHVKRIEKMLGRQDIGIWAPREIDIDILAYGDTAIESKTLTIPHKELCNRSFALVPLAEIAPNWQYPGKGDLYGKTAFEISREFSANKTEYKIGERELETA